MIVHALPITATVAGLIRAAAVGAKADLTQHETLQSLGSALYRDPGSIGVYWSGGIKKACATVSGWRLGNIRNPVIGLLPDHAGDHHGRAALLWSGADDAQRDIIDPRELGQRLLALARRERERDAHIERFLGCTFNKITHALESGAVAVQLTRREGEILTLLMSRPEVVFTKEMIMDALYSGIDEPIIKVIDVFVCKLRRKISPLLGGADIIETVWGRGYQFIPAGFVPALSAQRTRVTG